MPRWATKKYTVRPNDRFGRWTVIDEGAPRNGDGRSVRVRCECGTERTLRIYTIIYGYSKSCGCDRSTPIIHGAVGTPTYETWRGMKDRCRNPRHRAFRNYGGRGIIICERWHIFENFLADMGERPPGRTLDRIDNNGNYEPSNCRWATREQQINNRSMSRYIEFNGERLTISEWAKRLNIRIGAMIYRLRHWPIERAMTEAKFGNKRGG